MEAGGMVVVDGVAEFVEDDEVAQMFGQRHQVQAQRQVRCARCRSPIWSGWPGSLPNGIADRFALRVPLRGTVVQPSLRAATVPAGGVFFGRKGGAWRLLGEPFAIRSLAV